MMGPIATLVILLAARALTMFASALQGFMYKITSVWLVTLSALLVPQPIPAQAVRVLIL